MIITSGTSSRHMSAISDKIQENLKEKSIPIISVEGKGSSEWVLLDLGDIVVNIMSKSAENFMIWRVSGTLIYCSNENKKFFSGKRDSESRKLVLYLIFPIFIMFVVLLQTINLTVINGKKYETQSENNRIVSRTIYPTRGLIYDTHDKLLVENIASSQLNLVPERSTDTLKKIKEIADLLNLEKSFLLDIYEKQIKKPRYPFQPITLAKSLNDEQIALFSVSSEKFNGFSVETGLVRSVVNKKSLAHVLGYLGYPESNDLNEGSSFISGNQIGISGIEKTYHDQLSGKVGTRIEEKNVDRKFVRVLSENNAESGKDLKLSIDLDLQNFLIPFLRDKKVHW